MTCNFFRRLFKGKGFCRHIFRGVFYHFVKFHKDWPAGLGDMSISNWWSFSPTQTILAIIFCQSRFRWDYKHTSLRFLTHPCAPSAPLSMLRSKVPGQRWSPTLIGGWGWGGHVFECKCTHLHSFALTCTHFHSFSEISLKTCGKLKKGRASNIFHVWTIPKVVWATC